MFIGCVMNFGSFLREASFAKMVGSVENLFPLCFPFWSLKIRFVLLLPLLISFVFSLLFEAVVILVSFLPVGFLESFIPFGHSGNLIRSEITLFLNDSNQVATNCALLFDLKDLCINMLPHLGCGMLAACCAVGCKSCLYIDFDRRNLHIFANVRDHRHLPVARQMPGAERPSIWRDAGRCSVDRIVRAIFQLQLSKQDWQSPHH